MRILEMIKANFKRYLILTTLVITGLLVFSCQRKRDKKIDANIVNPVLGPDQKEKIIVDPVKHEITVITQKPNGDVETHKTYFPDHPTSITEGKDGKLTVEERKWGTEIRPYIGLGYDDSVRLHAGINFLYWHKIDLGSGVGVDPYDLKNTRLNLSLSYNFWSNTAIAASIDNHKVVGAFVQVRF